MNSFEMNPSEEGSPSQVARAKSQELFALANALPSGPQDVIFYARRNESLTHYSEWSGLSRTGLAETNQLPDTDKDIPVNTPVTIPMTADQLDRFEDKRRRFHEAYQATFYSKHTVLELQPHRVAPGDSLWKLARKGEHQVPLWLLEKVNPGRDLSVLSVGDTVKVPMLGLNNGPKKPFVEVKTQTKPKAIAKAMPVINKVKAPTAPVIKAKTPTTVAAPPKATETPKMQKAVSKKETIGGVEVRVQGGESLTHYSIWAKVSVANIVSANGLKNADHLQRGQRIMVPVPEMGMPDFYAKRKAFLIKRGVDEAHIAQHTTSPWKNHQVASGESAWIIAVKTYGISLDDLASANPTVNLERLRPGMSLRIPVETN